MLTWSILFFYGHAIRVGRGNFACNMSWISLMTEWLDIVLMYVVIIILHIEIPGNCFSYSLCVGYFVICSIKLYLWFFPIIFGYADTEWYIHAHMVVLDVCTDLPLVIVVIVDKGYEIHWFIFFDIVYKLIMLLRTIAFHGVVNLVLRRIELNTLHEQQLTRSQRLDLNEDSDDEEEQMMLNGDDRENDPLLL